MMLAMRALEAAPRECHSVMLEIAQSFDHFAAVRTSSKRVGR